MTDKIEFQVEKRERVSEVGWTLTLVQIVLGFRVFINYEATFSLKSNLTY